MYVATEIPSPVPTSPTRMLGLEVVGNLPSLPEALDSIAPKETPIYEERDGGGGLPGRLLRK